MASKAYPYIEKASGPVATVYRCKICGHIEKFPKGRPGLSGRGYGLSQGSKTYARMIKHFHTFHPEIFDKEII